MSWQVDVYEAVMNCFIPYCDEDSINKLIDRIIEKDLTEKQSEILFARFEAKQKVKDLAQYYGITSQSISRLEKRALWKIERGINKVDASKIINNV